MSRSYSRRFLLHEVKWWCSLSEDTVFLCEVNMNTTKNSRNERLELEEKVQLLVELMIEDGAGEKFKRSVRRAKQISQEFARRAEPDPDSWNVPFTV